MSMQRGSFGSSYGGYTGLGFVPYTGMMDRQVEAGLTMMRASAGADDPDAAFAAAYSSGVYKAWYQGAAVGAGVVAVAWIGAVVWYMRKKKR